MKKYIKNPVVWWLALSFIAVVILGILFRIYDLNYCADHLTGFMC